MWGVQSSIISQINLYVFSRVIMALIGLAVEKQLVPRNRRAYLMFGSVTWALVMWLFACHQKHLVKSLQASMEYLYRNERNLNPGESVVEWLMA